MKTRQTLLLLILSAFLFSSTACDKPKWDDPQYVNQKLQDEDRNNRSLAMSNLSSLSDEQFKEITPGLISVYNNDSVLKKEAMRHLLRIKSPEAVDIYFSELSTNDTDQAAAAVEVIGSFKDPKLNDKLIDAYKNSTRDDIKIAILKALTYAPTKAVVPILIETLKLDVDRRPIALPSYACDITTKLAIDDPTAISDELVNLVTLAMFYANRTNQTLDKDCGLTVQAIGQRAVPELIKIYKGEREDVKALFLKYDAPDSPYPPNLGKLIAVQRLDSMRAPELGPIALEDLQKMKEVPGRFRGAAAIEWRLKEGQTTSEELFALGDIPYPEGRELLEDVVKGGKLSKEWKTFADSLIQLQLRQDASFGLVRMGSREALDSLLDVATNGVIPDMEKGAQVLAKRGNPVADLDRYQLNWMVAKSYANLATPENRSAFEKLIATKKAKSKELGEKIESMLVMFDAHKECLSKGDDAAIAKCYGEKLKDSNPLVREKVAWELGRMTTPEAATVLNESLPIDNLDTREILTFNLYRIGNKDSIAVIDKILEDEASKGATYALDHYRLKLAKLWLQNNKK